MSGLYAWLDKEPLLSATPAPEHVQGILAVEHAYPARLDGCDQPHRPYQMHVIGLPGGCEKLHSYLSGKIVPFAIVAG